MSQPSFDHRVAVNKSKEMRRGSEGKSSGAPQAASSFKDCLKSALRHRVLPEQDKRDVSTHVQLKKSGPGPASLTQ